MIAKHGCIESTVVKSFSCLPHAEIENIGQYRGSLDFLAAAPPCQHLSPLAVLVNLMEPRLRDTAIDYLWSWPPHFLHATFEANLRAPLQRDPSSR